MRDELARKLKLTPQQRFGNGLACVLMRLIWGARFTDLGPFRAIRREGLSVPEDVSVVGYDDSAFMSCTDPALTTVRVPRYEMGRQSVRQLLRRLSGDTKSPTIVSLGFQIIDRESA